jgi:hypothetical protein
MGMEKQKLFSIFMTDYRSIAMTVVVIGVRCIATVRILILFAVNLPLAI